MSFSVYVFVHRRNQTTSSQKRSLAPLMTALGDQWRRLKKKVSAFRSVLASAVGNGSVVLATPQEPQKCHQQTDQCYNKIRGRLCGTFGAMNESGAHNASVETRDAEVAVFGLSRINSFGSNRTDCPVDLIPTISAYLAGN